MSGFSGNPESGSKASEEPKFLCWAQLFLTYFWPIFDLLLRIWRKTTLDLLFEDFGFFCFVFLVASTHPDLFSRGFREGISFPNFVERSIPELPLSKLCAVPFALQNRALFEGEKRAKMRKRGGQESGQKGKKDARKQVSICGCPLPMLGQLQGIVKSTLDSFSCQRMISRNARRNHERFAAKQCSASLPLIPPTHVRFLVLVTSSGKDHCLRFFWQKSLLWKQFRQPTPPIWPLYPLITFKNNFVWQF